MKVIELKGNDIDTQLRLIGGRIRELPLKAVFKNSLLADLDLALQYSAQDNALAVLTIVSVINDKLRPQLSRKRSCGGNSIFTAINRLQQTLLESPLAGGQPGPPGPPGPPGKIEFITAIATDTVCLPSTPPGGPYADLQKNTIYIADGLLFLWVCDLVFIAEPSPSPMNFWRISGAPPGIADGAGINQQIPSVDDGPQAACIQLFGNSGAQYQLEIAASMVGGPVSQVRLVFTAGIFQAGSYIGFNPEKTTYYFADGFKKINSGDTVDFFISV